MTNKQGIREELEIPEEITVKADKGIVYVKGRTGELSRNMMDKKITITVNGNILSFVAGNDNRKVKKILGTYMAHVKNMFRGVKEKHKYILKICSGHFPMNVSVSKNELIVKNFFGEKVPRVLKIKDSVDVKVDGEIITVESADKELAGQVASDIELLTTRANYDTRVFQDGLYIISKDGKELK